MKDQLFKLVSNSRGVVLFITEQAVPAASEFIGKKSQIKIRYQINNRAHVLNLQWPNQRLNLTEPAVDDFARAKQSATIGLDIPRADGQPCQRNFRRRLSAIR